MSLVSAIDAASGAIRRFGRSALPADATVPEAGATTKAAEVVSSSLPERPSDGIAVMADGKTSGRDPNGNRGDLSVVVAG